MQAVPSEFLAIDRKERANRPFFDLDLRPAEVRTCDFEDVVIEFDPERAMVEAARCIHCPDPAPCMVACPTANDIPSAMWLIEQGRFVEAAGIYHQTSSLPEVCGRVCPHEALCQGSCVLNKHHQPVLCGELEAFTVDYERRTQGYVIPLGIPTGKKVAVIGAGPAGLGCAEMLVQKGYEVTIFESKPAPGGLLVYGIPNFKLSKEVWEEKWGEFERAGVKFVPNTYIGKDKTIDGLFEEGFEAVFIGVGSEIDAKMEDTPGTNLPGVYEATDFLIRGNVDRDQLPENMREPLEVGKRVVVIGGGDTASDCLRTALRLGSKDVTCLYRRTEKEMPGGKKDRKMAREEGAKYRFLTQPVKFIAGSDGRLAAVECIEMKLGEPDAKGRRKPVPVEGSNFSVAADTAILALGYWPDPILGKTTPDLEVHDWGLITVKDKARGNTSRPGVFSGGDCVTGPDLVVTAMVGGRKAALSIDEYLKNKK
ncbi:MAG: NAD(P)-dependent oxidoreductase [Anaerolineales bacterium]|jgi:glutamate synthase (NADPH/NADH) small chain|uniref:NAD(P)-dependent oxidoreductase n=1 Tax=Candidatus Villigracilis affinis TaxID=3140682 RepID=UPI001B402514|nr:NAD(P)-dependent oxidoreductase [Anaerolineales bacterium]MBK9603237.1 NAD(P)-dependent oxidoreductase [Anaerolineales bacterium]MBL0346395.1 NAD(P)-dependent oxidoreductase [Anaerolineales bacterium]MBP8048083.1 NAD(P)-dependent oxidoreductase [Anaerolineales bacterium]